MPRVPVPDSFAGDHLLVCGTEDYHYPEAHVQVDARRARTLTVREDDGGRYVGPPEQHADAVREFLGVTDSGNADSETPREDSEAQPESGTCQTVKADGEICGRELPCPYHSEGES